MADKRICKICGKISENTRRKVWHVKFCDGKDHGQVGHICRKCFLKMGGEAEDWKLNATA